MTSAPAPEKLRLRPQAGRMPTLQFCRPAELRIDPAYQRSLELSASKRLVRQIAQEWNWDLCLPLVVAKRSDFIDRLFVIDGQHRLAAARLRGDIEQLPCVIVAHDSVAEEAAAFVKLNQQRQPLSGLDLFKAAVASGDAEAGAIATALADSGLSLAGHSNHTAWKPGMVSNVGGIKAAWRRWGEDAVRSAFRVMAQAFAGQVLQYAGSLFPGIVAVCADELRAHGRFADERFAKFVAALARTGQTGWRGAMLRARADDPGLQFQQASERVLRQAFAAAVGDPPLRPIAAPAPKPAVAGAAEPSEFAGSKWCEQCEMRITFDQLQTCKSRWCSLRKLG